MNKIKILSLSLILSLILVGCSSNNEQKDVTDSEEISIEDTSQEADDKLEDTKEGKKYDKLAYEDDNIKIILKTIEEAPEGKYVFNAVDLIFEVENKKDEDVVLQVESLSVDGKMVDSSNIVSSTDIQAKKIADAYVSITDEGGHEIPEIKDDVELRFKLFSWDNDDFRHELKSAIDLN